MDEKKWRLIDVAGDGGFLTEPESETSFLLDHTFLKPFPPCFKNRPKNMDEIQKIVLWANENLSPLMPLSSGGPRFRGDTDSLALESITVILGGMKRTLKIDRRNQLTLIEPGVTYIEFQPVLQEEELSIVAPLLPRKNKSAIASLLNREPMMSPKYQWNLLEPLRSLVIVWGNGDKFYGGSGTFRGEKDEDWQAG
jgi:glycolate oxidase